MTAIKVGTPENYEEKTLCCLVLDRSGSMTGKPIDELNTALKQFKTDIESNSVLSDSLEIAIVAFDDNVEIIQKPALIHNIVMPTLITNGLTSLNAAIKEAIRIVEERKDYYKQSGQTHKRPWIVVMTDGAPTDGDVTSLGQQIKADTKEKKYVLLPIGVDGADMSVLNELAGYTGSGDKLELMKPLPMESAKFSEFFEWLSRSMQIITQSKEGQTVQLGTPTWISGFNI